MVNNEDHRDHLIQCEKSCRDICERITYFNPPGSNWHNYYPIYEVTKQAKLIAQQAQETEADLARVIGAVN